MAAKSQLGQDSARRVLRLIDGAMGGVQEPRELLDHPHRQFLSPFLDVGVGRALPLNVRL